MRRGDIITVAGGVYAKKPRPALIVQDDRLDATDSLTVCPFTRTAVDAPLLRVPITADDQNGRDQDSFLMVDKITTVRRSYAGAVVGRLEATTLGRVRETTPGLPRLWRLKHPMRCHVREAASDTGGGRPCSPRRTGVNPTLTVDARQGILDECRSGRRLASTASTTRTSSMPGGTPPG